MNANTDAVFAPDMEEAAERAADREAETALAPAIAPDGPIVNTLLKAKVEERVKALDQQTLDNLLAMTMVAGYGLGLIDDKWEELVPSQAVPLLRYIGTPPDGGKKAPGSTKKALYSLQQKLDAEKALKRLPYLLATYVDILSEVVREQRELRKQADEAPAAEPVVAAEAVPT